MPSHQEQCVFGVFKGMGDLLWASPVVRDMLNRDLEVHLLVFPSPPLIDFCSLVDFGANTANLHLHPVSPAVKGLPGFIAQMRSLNPTIVWISPHAPAADSSWRIPLLLRLIQSLFWAKARLIGAQSEKLSRLFHVRLDIDRTLPLPQREWSAYRAFRHDDRLPAEAPRPRFIPAVMQARNGAPLYDLVIHPGANARSRIWPFDKYPALIAALPSQWKIALIAPPSEITAIQSALPPALSRRVTLLTGTLQETLQVFAAARLLLVMNSGTMHFAEVLGIPAVALFGQQHPSQVIDTGSVTPVYRVSVPCQPCGHATCGQPQPYCLTNLDPLEVAACLMQVASSGPQLVSIETASD